MSELKKEFKNYMDDLEKNIQNQQDLDYVKGRTTEFMNVILEQIENILNFKEDKISQIEKIQNDLENKIATIQQEVYDIEENIYVEDEIEDFEDEMEFDEDQNNYDFEIVCPYCENEFLIDLDKDSSEIECPECKNVIELDWTGSVEEESSTQNNSCGAGHCSQCPGCGYINNQKENEDEDDDM